MMQRKKKVCFAVLVVSQILIWGILFLENYFYYMTNDDTTMVAIASGAYGIASEYVVNLHIILGWILKKLFLMAPIINWMTVLLLCLSFVAFFVIDGLICFKSKVCNNVWVYILVASIINVSWFMLVSYFTFTVVAYTVGISGCLVLLYSVFGEKKIGINFKWLIAAIILLFLCTLIRAEVIKSLLIVIVPLLILMIFRKRIIEVVVVVLVPLILMEVMILSNTWICNLNPQQKEFLNWGRIRSVAVDASVIDYVAFEEQFNSVGVDEAVYQMIYNQYYFDYDAIDVDVFSKMSTMRKLSEKYNFNFLDVLQQVIGIEKWDSDYEGICLPLMIFILGLILLLDIKHWKEYLLIVIGCLLTHVLFCVINRPVYRVVMPNYVFGYILLIFLGGINIQEKKTSLFAHLCVEVLSIILFVSVTYFFVYKNPTHTMDRITRHNEERQQIYKYLEENDDKLYLSGNLSVYSIDVCRPVFEFAGSGGHKWNLIGNWETFSVPYYNLIDNYDIDNPNRLALEAVDSDTIRIISNQGMSYIDFSLFFSHYIEKQIGKRVQIVPDEHIAELPDGDWWTFRVISVEE